jgi:hypothetical protein
VYQKFLLATIVEAANEMPHTGVVKSTKFSGAENYDDDNPAQSANRYRPYDEWREGF